MELSEPDYWHEGERLIDELWNLDYGTYEVICGDNSLTIELTTGGWSENEKAIDKLSETMFWMLYWQKSERGGKYTFRKEFN